MALVCGEQIVGDVILEDEVLAGPNGEEGVDRVPVLALYPRQVSDAQIDEIDRALPSAALREEGDSFQRSIHLALRWYLRLATASTPLDRFTAAFLALDSLCNSYHDSHPPTEDRPNLTKFLELVHSAREKGVAVDHAMEQAVHGLLGNLPLAGKFRRLRESLDDDQEEIERDFEVFRASQKIRNQIVHGGRSDVTHDEADELRELLEKVLAAAVGVTLPPAVPSFHEVLAEHIRRVSSQ